MNEKATIWLTGLSGAGKSALAEKFIKENPEWVLLDGDVLRKGLCSDLGFSADDRKENMRRLRNLCQLFNQNGKNVITAFICPFEEDRIKATKEIDNCFIIAIKSDLKTCEDRDVKGLYKKARDGIIPNFTGIDSPYEHPASAYATIDTQKQNLEASYLFLNNAIAEAFRDIEFKK